MALPRTDHGNDRAETEAGLGNRLTGLEGDLSKQDHNFDSGFRVENPKRAPGRSARIRPQWGLHDFQHAANILRTF